MDDFGCACSDFDTKQGRYLTEHNDDSSGRYKAMKNWDGDEFEKETEPEETDDETVDADAHSHG